MKRAEEAKKRASEHHRGPGSKKDSDRGRDHHKKGEHDGRGDHGKKKPTLIFV